MIEIISILKLGKLIKQKQSTNRVHVFNAPKILTSEHFVHKFRGIARNDLTKCFVAATRHLPDPRYVRFVVAVSYNVQIRKDELVVR